MRKVFFIISVLVLVSIAVQYYLAGVGFFSEGEQGLGEHGTTGRIILPILFVLLILSAAIARAGKSTIWLSVLMLVLLILQTLIFIFTGLIFGVDETSAAIPVPAYFTVGLHALNPIFMIWVGTVIMLRARKLAFPKQEVERPVTSTATTA